MTEDEEHALRQLVVDEARIWPKLAGPRELVRRLDAFARKVYALPRPAPEPTPAPEPPPDPGPTYPKRWT
jgi:hypothetical protein